MLMHNSRIPACKGRWPDNHMRNRAGDTPRTSANASASRRAAVIAAYTNSASVIEAGGRGPFRMYGPTCSVARPFKRSFSLIMKAH